MATARTTLFASVIKNHGISAYFACTPISMGYLHGFFEDAHERFMILAIRDTGEIRAILPSLAVTQSQRAGISDNRGWADGEDPMAHVRELAADWGLAKAKIAVDDMMPAKSVLTLQATLSKAEFLPGQPLIAELMRNKDESELDLMTKSAKIADDVFESLKGYVKAGLTEREVERFIRDEFTRLGGDPTFCIVGAGSGGAEPHHINGNTVLNTGDVVILDFGCEFEGYQSDITRTVSIGPASEKAKDVYKIVYEAYMAGRSAIQPGVTAGSVDAAARKVIADAGYGPYFFHRLGHGIGMNGHEEPYIIGGSEEILAPGNCFSVEPGIYLAGEFGVRIETIVACTADGHRNLNAEPSPTLLEL